ncbi:MAG: polysaccharide deacetylase family protein [bacterium]
MVSWLIFVSLWFIALSCRFNWWRKDKPGIPILMYHNIGVAPKTANNKKLWVTEQKFRHQMAYLYNYGYQPITFKDLSSLPDNPVIITFDDGAKNNYTVAFPILKQYNFKACMFLSTARSELSTAELKEMQDFGIEFGSHTNTHPNLRKISEDTAKEEITGSKKILEERLNTQIIAFAYPYGAGAYDEKINQMVKEAGYTYACGIRQGKVTLPITTPYCLKRLLIRGDDLMIDFILNLRKGRSRF